MEYKLLPREEWNKLAPIWARYGSVPPVADPFALVSVALDEGKIVGGMGTQAVRFIEGIWNEPEYSGKVEFRKLRRRLLDGLTPGSEYYAMAATKAVERICQYGNMERMDWTVYRGRA